MLYLKFKNVMNNPKTNTMVEKIPSIVKISFFLIFIAIKVLIISVITNTNGTISFNAKIISSKSFRIEIRFFMLQYMIFIKNLLIY